MLAGHDAEDARTTEALTDGLRESIPISMGVWNDGDVDGITPDASTERLGVTRTDRWVGVTSHVNRAGLQPIDRITDGVGSLGWERDERDKQQAQQVRDLLHRLLYMEVVAVNSPFQVQL